MTAFGEKTIQERIEEIYPQLESITYYRLLMVDRQAEIPEIKRAYRKLVHLMHPDRHANELEPEQLRKLEHIFNEINTAYSVLTNPEEKVKYDQQLFMAESRGAATRRAPDAEVAQAQYKRGMDALKKKELARAIEFFKSASSLNPDNPEYLAKLALAQSSHPRFRREAEENCRRAIKLDHENPNYHALLGRIMQRQGRLEEALQHYHHALAWDPNHRLARREAANVRAELRANNPTFKDRVKMWFEKRKRKSASKQEHRRPQRSSGRPPGRRSR